jgi:hypothetical protein
VKHAVNRRRPASRIGVEHDSGQYGAGCGNEGEQSDFSTSQILSMAKWAEGLLPYSCPFCFTYFFLLVFGAGRLFGLAW